MANLSLQNIQNLLEEKIDALEEELRKKVIILNLTIKFMIHTERLTYQ